MLTYGLDRMLETRAQVFDINYCCFTAALLLLYCCFTAALLLLYCYFTADELDRMLETRSQVAEEDDFEATGGTYVQAQFTHPRLKACVC
jgi:hypothetical protein